MIERRSAHKTVYNQEVTFKVPTKQTRVLMRFDFIAGNFGTSNTAQRNPAFFVRLTDGALPVNDDVIVPVPRNNSQGNFAGPSQWFELDLTAQEITFDLTNKDFSGGLSAFNNINIKMTALIGYTDADRASAMLQDY